MRHHNATNEQPRWIGIKVLGGTRVFWWPAGTDPDTYDADYGRAMDMAIARYPTLRRGVGGGDHGKLAMVSDLEAAD